MSRTTVGELEELLLLVLLQMVDETYAVPLAEELGHRTGRDVSPATAYMVMRRLEDRGFVTSRVGAPAPERGGRPRRFYRVVRAKAVPLLKASRRARLALWKGLEPLLDPP